MPNKLLVVESPNKVKKIKAYLEEFEPGEWGVVATVGHFRGLPPMDRQEFGDVVDTTTWAEVFATDPTKADAIGRMKTAIKKSRKVYLAADDDREGEAIAWHVAEHFGLDRAARVRCREITAKGIVNAIQAAGDIDTNLVAAQRARAVLDYLIGLELSRRLWRFGAKSAGRLQSAALRIVVEREKTIAAFEVEPYWQVFVDFGEGFTAALCTQERPTADELDENPELEPGRRLVPLRFADRASAHEHAAACEGGKMAVEKLETKASLRHPPKPFTTADLLGAASRQLKLGSGETTKLAQRLFEAGLITYIRTDSVALADEAVSMVRDVIAREHPTLLPAKPRKAKDAAGAQAAHEAIRPTKMTLQVGADLNTNERALYELIYNRTLWSQMKAAELHKTTVTIAPSGAGFRLVAQGTVVKDAGWMGVADVPATKEVMLPTLAKGQRLAQKKVRLEDGKTRPPPRFTEPSLVKYLERRGIGRPSTYAAMIATLKGRGYVREEKGRLAPEPLGVAADDLVRLGFDELSREDFTAKTEKALDGIASGKVTREDFLSAFLRKFTELLRASEPVFDAFAQAHPELNAGSAAEIKKPCPKCGGVVVEQPYKKAGKARKFYRCKDDGCGWKDSCAPGRIRKTPCPKCGSAMMERKGKKSRFWACTGFPECKETAPVGRGR